MSDLLSPESGNPNKAHPGIGMPGILWLQEFGDLVYLAFGEPPYQVGSSLTGKQWRDVDVRLILSDEKYAAMGFGDPKNPHESPRWVAFVLAFSALGKQMTGLPIDFQIQSQTEANENPANDGLRSALIVGALRRQNREAFKDRLPVAKG